MKYSTDYEQMKPLELTEGKENIEELSKNDKDKNFYITKDETRLSLICLKLSPWIARLRLVSMR